MKTESLEALLIDRSMGELPAATAELLDEYLAQNREVAKKSDDLLDAVVLAKRTLQPSVMKVSRPFPRESIRREGRRLRWRRGTLQFLKLAACFALGIVVAGLVKEKSNQQVLSDVLPVTPSVAVSPPLKNENSFWSVARLEAEAKKRAAARQEAPVQYELRWDSPQKKPDLEKKS